MMDKTRFSKQRHELQQNFCQEVYKPENNGIRSSKNLRIL